MISRQFANSPTMWISHNGEIMNVKLTPRKSQTRGKLAGKFTNQRTSGYNRFPICLINQKRKNRKRQRTTKKRTQPRALQLISSDFQSLVPTNVEFVKRIFFINFTKWLLPVHDTMMSNACVSRGKHINRFIINDQNERRKKLYPDVTDS